MVMKLLKRAIIFSLVLLVSVCTLLPLSVFGLTAPKTTTTKTSTSKLAVTPKGYDDMGAVLKDLGYSATEIDEEDLTSESKLSQYDAVYINCSAATSSVFEDAGSAVKKYVEGGGTVYASDWANSIIEKAFPGKIKFYNGMGENSEWAGAESNSRVGQEGKVTANVTDSGLAAVLGKTSVEVNFDLSSWAVIDDVGSDTNVLMRGPAKVFNFSGSDLSNPDSWGGSDNTWDAQKLEELQKQKSSAEKTLDNKPFVVTFKQGKGQVLYTSFHNEAQVTSDTKAVLNWFAVWTKASKLGLAAHELADADKQEVLQEVIDSINKGDTKKYKFNATGDADFKVTLNFGGSALTMTIINPDGKEVSKEVSSPPYTETIKATKGEYTIKVQGTDVPEKNYAFAATVTGPEKARVGGMSTTTTPTTTKPASKSWMDYLKDPMYLAIGGGILLLIIMLIVASVLQRRKRKAAAILVTPAPSEPTPPAPEASSEPKEKAKK